MMYGSVYPRCLPYGVGAMALTLALLLTKQHYDPFIGHPYAHQMFSISVGFVLVFRSNLSYNRFWEGRGALQLMSSKWDDCAVQLMTFERATRKGSAAEESQMFCNSQVHLFSLLHAAALAHLRNTELEGLLNATECEDTGRTGNTEFLGVLGGVTDEEFAALQTTHNKPFMIYSWICRDVIQRHKAGGLDVPPPILSRVFQTASDGMVAFMNAKKIRDTPFPFPYAQMVSVLVLLFCLSAPVLVALFVSNVFFALILVFFCVVGVVALNEVAKEIEEPFGFDINDLPLSELQMEFNKRVYLLLGEYQVGYMSGCDLPLELKRGDAIVAAKARKAAVEKAELENATEIAAYEPAARKSLPDVIVASSAPQSAVPKDAKPEGPISQHQQALQLQKQLLQLKEQQSQEDASRQQRVLQRQREDQLQLKRAPGMEPPPPAQGSHSPLYAATASKALPGAVLPYASGARFQSANYASPKPGVTRTGSGEQSPQAWAHQSSPAASYADPPHPP
eukprot:CAMPEP_0114563510 /NCGR_PEP_ID=MMETSP0114-20121206/13153_1 /TAXON_ID=31324 /ORGANISM="Goniomonas sp, Strain m" /LENGTH=507 /DNA_ID=CAMNT_0001749371 /DNA_START=20 /DNA_END=1539 /DNA_ORIENTATION=+